MTADKKVTECVNGVTKNSVAELANETGNGCYRGGRFEEAVDAYTIALSYHAHKDQRELAARDSERRRLSQLRSKYYANRAQARMQLKDFEEAAKDCQESVEEDPGNAKALVRWGLCGEAVGRWDEALDHFETGSKLLQPGSALLRVSLEGARRARANRIADCKVAHEETMPEELVHHGQMLRLSFNNPLPLQCIRAEWFDVSLGISNEFGLWRRRDFNPTPTNNANETSSVSNRSSTPTPSRPQERNILEGTGLKATAVMSETAAKLKLIVEARDLEEFGGRTDAVAHKRQGHAQPTGYQTNAKPEMDGLPSADGEFPVDRNGVQNPTNTDFEDPYSVSVETDGDIAIGPSGKVAFRARFLLTASSGLSNRAATTPPTAKAVSATNSARGPGESGTAGNGATRSTGKTNVSLLDEECAADESNASGSNRGRPLLFLLRVSVDDAEAMKMLGRAVVPVLSLPIAISGAEDKPFEDETNGVNAEERDKRSLSEQTLAANSFQAGATTCREAIVPVTVTSSACGSRDDRASRPNRVVLVAESPGQLGIGGKVWDSAFVLCDYLAKVPASVASQPSPSPSASHKANGTQGLAVEMSRTDSVVRPAQNGNVEGVEIRSGSGQSTNPIEKSLSTEPCSISGTHGCSCRCSGEAGSRRKLLEGKRVLELGAGTGLVSVCSSLLGASAVMATDFKDVTALVRMNVALNFSTTNKQQSPISTVPLVWGESSKDVATFEPEVLVMSDVVYDPSGYEPLLATLLDIMQPEMIAVMAHRHRHPEDYEFFRRLNELFIVREETTRWWQKAPSSVAAELSPERDTSGTRKDQSDGTDVQIFRIWTR